MKFTVLLFALTALLSVACNKQEEAPATTEAAPAAVTAEGHTVEHQHVTEGVDHAHDDTHHGDHDHKAHHPGHDEESGEEKKN
jgi:ABC-type enterochelin transport system substrate-binding protein